MLHRFLGGSGNGPRHHGQNRALIQDQVSSAARKLLRRRSIGMWVFWYGGSGILWADKSSCHARLASRQLVQHRVCVFQSDNSLCLLLSCVNLGVLSFTHLMHSHLMVPYRSMSFSQLCCGSHWLWSDSVGMVYIAGCSSNSELCLQHRPMPKQPAKAFLSRCAIPIKNTCCSGATQRGASLKPGQQPSVQNRPRGQQQQQHRHTAAAATIWTR